MITDEMLQHAHGRITGGNRVTMINHEAWIPLPDKERTRAVLEAVLPMIRAQVVEEAAKVADGYHQRALAWARTVRGLEKHIDETDSSRIATAIRAMKGDALNPDRDSSG